MKIVLSSSASRVCLVASDASRIAKVFASIAPRTPLLGFSITLPASGGTANQNDSEVQKERADRPVLLVVPPNSQAGNPETQKWKCMFEILWFDIKWKWKRGERFKSVEECSKTGPKRKPNHVDRESSPTGALAWLELIELSVNWVGHVRLRTQMCHTYH